MKHFFFGGVHPSYKKEMSTQTDALLEPNPAEVVIPLHQHVGVPCKPLVSVGDRVLMGQKIGDGEGQCVPVHASVSGTVVAIEARRHPNGQLTDAIVIENDFQDTVMPHEGCDVPADKLDIDKVLHTVREAGIVGMGGAAFPGNIKALSAMDNVDTIIANACECEPYITSDDTLMRKSPKEVFEGMMILHRVLSPDRMVLAVEDNKAVAIEGLRALQKDYPAIELAVLPTRYPQGSEKQLIQAVTGREVPPAGLPVSVGCVVFNVSTFAAIYQAVRCGMPLVRRIVTVTGEGISKPQNMSVRIGTPFAELIKAAGGLKENTVRVINGGPMMGVAQGELSVPVVKATNSVLCLTDGQAAERIDKSVCIRCGKCLGVCPMHLQPLYMYRYAMAENTKQLVRLNIFDCMECGCCAFTCPAGISLVEAFRSGKKLVKEAASK